MSFPTESIRDFIEENKKLLDQNDFTELYHRGKSFRAIYLTWALYNAGIDPIPYFKSELPTYFLLQTSDLVLNKLDITPLKHLVLTPNISVVGRMSIYDSTFIETIDVLGKPIFRAHCFDSIKNVTIKFNDTKEEFLKLVKVNQLLPTDLSKNSFVECSGKIICTDGTLKIDSNKNILI